MVQRSMLFPTDKPLMVDVSEDAFWKMPVPLTMVHIPPDGLAPKTVEEEQIVWSEPAEGVAGVLETVIVTSSDEILHTPLLTVQRRILLPCDKPETAL